MLREIARSSRAMTGLRNGSGSEAAGTHILCGPLIRFEGDPFAGGRLVYDTDAALVAEDGLIAAVGPANAVLRAHPGAEVRRTDLLIAPGFVDCHMHYPQIGVIASYGAQLLDWLTRYTFPEEARFGDPEHAARAARASLTEQLRHGYTVSASFCTIHPGSVDAWFAEAERRGVRAVGGRVLMDRNAPDDLRDTAQSAYDDSATLIARWHGRRRATYALSPRFAPTSTPAQLEAAGALWAAHSGCLMQTHLSENHREIAWVSQLFPDAPDYLGVYERFGLVGPGAVFGHAIHLTPRERATLAERGASVAHCPTSNQFLGSGECDVAGLAASGVRVGLATDTGGGTSCSPFATMRAAYEVGQRRGISIPPDRLWWLATAGSARALHLEERVGNLAPGMEADLVLIDTAATPILAQRVAQAETIAEVLFALAVLGDDRAVAETWSGGRRVHERGGGGRETSGPASRPKGKASPERLRGSGSSGCGR
jgi:guanine deaminase